MTDPVLSRKNRSGLRIIEVYNEIGQAGTGDSKGPIQNLAEPMLGGNIYLVVSNVVDTPEIQFKFWKTLPINGTDFEIDTSVPGPISANGTYLFSVLNGEYGAPNGAYDSANFILGGAMRFGLAKGTGVGTPTFDAVIYLEPFRNYQKHV